MVFRSGIAIPACILAAENCTSSGKFICNFDPPSPIDNSNSGSPNGELMYRFCLLISRVFAYILMIIGNTNIGNVRIIILDNLVVLFGKILVLAMKVAGVLSKAGAIACKNNEKITKLLLGR